MIDVDFDKWIGKLLVDREPSAPSSPNLRRVDWQSRGFALRNLGLWSSIILALVTLAGVASGDDPTLRLGLLGFWLAGYGVSEWARRRRKFNLATLTLYVAAWLVIGAASWYSGGFRSADMACYVLIIFCAGGVGGRQLTIFIGLLSVLAAFAMWGMALLRGLPPELLDRSPMASLAQELGILSFSLIVALVLIRKMRMATEATDHQRERALLIGESFKELFMKSPAPMALTEAAARESDQARRGLATNDAFKATFETPPEDDEGGRGYQAELWSGEDLREARLLVSAQGRLDRFRARMKTTSGADRVCLVSAGPVLWEGGHAFLWTFQDVTQTEELRARLENTNIDLERRVDGKAKQLEMARKELERSERLSKLGEMVAGVAHEINTPIGNALLAASTLTETTRRLTAMATGAAMSRAELTVLCRRLHETGELTMENLERAGDIIKSFKQLSSDQTSQARREFRLREVLEGAFKAMGPSLRGSAVSWALDLDDAAEAAIFAGFPGALSQIATCLASNALMHGFDGAPVQGVDRIIIAQARIHGGRALISFVDNGVGIPKSLSLKVFEPFFTTKAGKGGTGLGLAVAWNLAREALGGELSLPETQPEEGCQLDLDIPLVGPLRITEAPQGRAEA